MRMDGHIDFVEFPGHDLLGMRRFYAAAFGWTFETPRSDYLVFRGAGLDGGFSADPKSAPAEPLVVFYVHDLEAARRRVKAAGGEITRDIFPTAGGRRFHFRDPGENEVAVWSDQKSEPLRAAAQAPRPRPQAEREPACAFAFWRNWGVTSRAA